MAVAMPTKNTNLNVIYWLCTYPLHFESTIHITYFAKLPATAFRSDVKNKTDTLRCELLQQANSETTVPSFYRILCSRQLFLNHFTYIPSRNSACTSAIMVVLHEPQMKYRQSQLSLTHRQQILERISNIVQRQKCQSLDHPWLPSINFVDT